MVAADNRRILLHVLPDGFHRIRHYVKRRAKQTWKQIMAATGCSRTTLQRIAKRLKAA